MQASSLPTILTLWLLNFYIQNEGDTLELDDMLSKPAKKNKGWTLLFVVYEIII